MHIIKAFTKKSMAKNRKRTWMTVIGVALSTALLLTVAGMASSFWRSLALNEVEKNGDFYYRFDSLPGDAVDIVTSADHVTESSVVQYTGTAKLDDPFISSSPFLFLRAINPSAEDQLAIKLADGKLPEADGEIALTEDFIEKEMQGLKVGDTVTLHLGKRVFPDSEPDVYYEPGETEGVEKITPDYVYPYYETEETFESEGDKTFTVTGILSHISDFVARESSAGYPGIVYLGEPDPAYITDVYVTYDDSVYGTDYNRDITYQLMGKYHGKQSWYEPVRNDYVRYLGGAGLENNMMFFGLCGIVLLVVIVSSIFVIRNSFYISVSEKEVQLGMLRSIGATSKQMKGILFLEGFYVWLRGIVAGLLLGVGVVFGLIKLVEGKLSGGLTMKLHFFIPWWLYVGVAVLSLAAVFFAVWGPANSAAKLTPIEAIRGNGEIKIRNKKLKSPKFIRKFFGIGGVIATKNLKRSRRQYRATIISLVVATAVFISAASFVKMVEKMVTDTLAVYDVDVRAEIYMSVDDDVKEEDFVKERDRNEKFMMDLAGLPDADEVYYSRYHSARIDMSKYGSDEGIRSFGSNETLIELEILSPADFGKYLKDIGAKDADPASAVVLVNRAQDWTSTKNDVYIEPLNLSAGDDVTVTLRRLAGRSSDDEVQVTGKITTVTDTMPGILKEGKSMTLLVSQENKEFYGNLGNIGTIYFLSDDPAELGDQIKKYGSDHRVDIRIENYGVESQQNEQLIFVVKFFLFGFIIVITLIGVTNIFNTITTNMEMRSREFAMLRSIGMTDKEFSHMIRLESIFYGMRALIIGIPLGSILSYLMYGRLSKEYQTGYEYPFIPVLISIVAVMAIVGFTMWYSMSKIKKQNIIETIRRRNV